MAPRNRKQENDNDDGGGNGDDKSNGSASGIRELTPPSPDTPGTESPNYPSRITLERTPSRKGESRSRYHVKAPGTPFHDLDLNDVGFLHDHTADAVKKGWANRRRVIFFLGALLGALLAWHFSYSPELDEHFQSLRLLVDEHLAGIDVPTFSLPTDLAEMTDKLWSQPREWFTTKDFEVGRRLNAEGYRKEHPVILIPGIVSTGLESWSTSEATSSYFRKRLWGTTTMIRTVALEKEMWIKHISLDPQTGLDPPGIKVRAAEGFDAASYFVTGYWIWSKIIENLAAIGYDPNSLQLAAYDWRLSFLNLELRDRYFSKLKWAIEQNKIIHGKKTVLCGHSMGATVVMFFLKWVEAEGYGYGGPNWVEDHLDSFISIAGTFLGVPKAMSALLSGEMRDTVELNPAGVYLLERFFSRKERGKLFRTWAGSASMLPKGGDAVWGDQLSAPDDPIRVDSAIAQLPNGTADTHGRFFSFRETAQLEGGNVSVEAVQPNLTLADSMTFLLQHTPSTFQKMLQSNYSNGMERDPEQIKRNNADPTKWTNPLEVELPRAPSFKIYCLYGHGKPTERTYWYIQGSHEHDETQSEGEHAQCVAPECDNTTDRVPLDMPLLRGTRIDSSVNIDAPLKVTNGVRIGEGDGTVSLLSLGAMCVEGWKQPRYNPANVRVVTHEQRHDPRSGDLRGAGMSSDHIDILGSFRLNEMIGKIASGHGEEIQDHFVSDIQTYASRIDWSERSEPSN